MQINAQGEEINLQIQDIVPVVDLTLLTKKITQAFLNFPELTQNQKCED